MTITVFDSVTIKVSDGIKQGDYAPSKVYDLTGILTNADEAQIKAGIKVLETAGEVFLGRTAPPATTTKGKGKAEKPDPTAPPAEASTPASDPLAGAASAASEPGTATAGGLPDTGGDPGLDDILGGETKPIKEPEPPKEITNEELVHAVMAKNEALKDPAPIRALVESYNPSPGLRVFKATEIEQKDRAGFLEKLSYLS